MEKIPIGSNLFKPSQAIKTNNTPGTTTTPTTPNTPTTPTGLPCTSHAVLPDPCSSSPLMADSAISITNFCATCGLNAATADGLDNLGFQVGDDLKKVDHEDYIGAGFKPLAQKCVLVAYAKYKKDSIFWMMKPLLCLITCNSCRCFIECNLWKFCLRHFLPVVSNPCFDWECMRIDPKRWEIVHHSWNSLWLGWNQESTEEESAWHIHMPPQSLSTSDLWMVQLSRMRTLWSCGWGVILGSWVYFSIIWMDNQLSVCTTSFTVKSKNSSPLSKSGTTLVAT